jgi:hypothetical protein
MQQKTQKQTMQEPKQASRMEIKKSWGSDGFSFFLSFFRLCNQKEEDMQERKKI